jgi:hypothetical protein
MECTELDLRASIIEIFFSGWEADELGLYIKLIASEAQSLMQHLNPHLFAHKKS